jgi:hypothetical protein
MMKYHAENNKPQSLNGLSAAARRSVGTSIMKVPQAMQELIAEEKNPRDKLDYADYQLNDVPLTATAAQADADKEEEEEEENGFEYDYMI